MKIRCNRNPLMEDQEKYWIDIVGGGQEVKVTGGVCLYINNNPKVADEIITLIGEKTKKYDFSDDEIEYSVSREEPKKEVIYASDGEEIHDRRLDIVLRIKSKKYGNGIFYIEVKIGSDLYKEQLVIYKSILDKEVYKERLDFGELGTLFIKEKALVVAKEYSTFYFTFPELHEIFMKHLDNNASIFNWFESNDLTELRSSTYKSEYSQVSLIKETIEEYGQIHYKDLLSEVNRKHMEYEPDAEPWTHISTRINDLLTKNPSRETPALIKVDSEGYSVDLPATQCYLRYSPKYLAKNKEK